MGGVQLFSQLHSRTRAPNPHKPQPPAPPPEWETPRQVFARQASRDIQALPGLLLGAGRALVNLANLQTVRDALRFGASLGRVLADPDAEGSPLLRGRSLSWRFLVLDVVFADLRAASKAAGGSLNDAFLAALLGAFRIYHEDLGTPIAKMPVAIPISIRSRNDADGGNRFTGARLAAPVGIANPHDRIQAIGRLIRTARNEPALDGLGLFAPVLSRLPPAVVGLLAGGLTKSNDLQASNVPGVREDLYLAGAKIERSYGFGPLPGCASMITLVTHGDTCCVAANIDPAAITEPQHFARCLVEGFAEVLALHPGAAPPQLRG
jgi:WS/DGAT/MGAT family acyltransferase